MAQPISVSKIVLFFSYCVGQFVTRGGPCKSNYTCKSNGNPLIIVLSEQNAYRRYTRPAY